MVEGLMLWGAGQMLLRPILEDLAKDVAKDAAKSYVGRCFKSVFSVIHRDALTRAVGRALKALLEHIEDELLDADLGKEAIKKLIPAIQAFLDHDAVRGSIHSLFLQPGYKALPQEFANAWSESNPKTSLPDEFSWQKTAKRFTRKVEDIRNGDVELKATFDSLANAQNADNLKELAGLPPEFDLDAYREALIERHGNLNFDSLDTSGANYSGTRLWSVFVPQSVREFREYAPQLLELPKEHQKRLMEKNELDESQLVESEQMRKAYFEQPMRPVLDICADETLPRMVILGDPGSGKSSLLRYLALEWARIENVQERYTRPLPLLIELRQYNHWQCPSGKSFLRYLHEASNWHRLNQQTLNYLLKQAGQAVLLLDGLDEVFDPAQRETVLNDIQRFSNEYPSTPIIVTSRVVGYKQQRLLDADFRHFMLQDLDNGQIDNFLTRWHEVTFTDTDEAQSKRLRLSKAIHNSTAIAMLAGNPLLLTMMAILNRHQELPRDRADLYEQASRVLLHQWDTERALEGYEELRGEVDLRAKQAILRKLAYTMQNSPDGLSGNIVDDDTLTELIEDYLRQELHFKQARAAAISLVKQLRERNFILCFLGADSYGFVHRTFLEYFCAADIVHRFNIEKSLTQEGLVELFEQHRYEDDWREVLRLICGQIDEQFVGPVIERLIALADMPNWGGETPLPELPLAIYCLSEIRVPARIEKCAHLLLDAVTDVFINAKAGFYLGAFLSSDLATAWRELGIRWPGREKLEAIALSHIQRFKCESSWINWPRFIADVTQRRDLIEALGGVCGVDNAFFARAIALEQLCEHWPDKTTRTLVCERAIKEELDIVREFALRFLVEHWPDDATRKLLSERSVQDEGVDLRRFTLIQLAEHWPDESSRKLLSERAVQDEHDVPRHLALELLAEHWPDETTRTLLGERAVQDENERPRRIALEQLAEHWPDETTRTLLSERAVQDEYDGPRRVALEQLAEHWPDETTRTLLSERAVHDEDELLRHVALAQLAEHWPDETTRKLISELAPANATAASLLGKEHSEFGWLVYTQDLDGLAPLLDPRKPISREYIEKAARKLSIDPAHIDETVRSLSAHLGWDITKGSAAD